MRRSEGFLLGIPGIPSFLFYFPFFLCGVFGGAPTQLLLAHGWVQVARHSAPTLNSFLYLHTTHTTQTSNTRTNLTWLMSGLERSTPSTTNRSAYIPTSTPGLLQHTVWVIMTYICCMYICYMTIMFGGLRTYKGVGVGLCASEPGQGTGRADHRHGRPAPDGHDR